MKKIIFAALGLIWTVVSNAQQSSPRSTFQLQPITSPALRPTRTLPTSSNRLEAPANSFIAARSSQSTIKS